MICVKNFQKFSFTSQIRKEIRIRDRLRKKILKSQNENNIIKYKKQRNKVNNIKKIAKEKFENNLENFFIKQLFKPQNVLETNADVNQI
jgi:hypothetical protein